MDREGFLEAIRKQYADDIHEAFIECQVDEAGKRRVDLFKLNACLKKLWVNSQVEGLPEKDFLDLVRTAIPHWDQLDFWHERRAA